jgi:N-dimethylarginine dimethylaminohydrolase
MSGCFSEHGRLTTVLVKHARDAFVSDEQIAAQWRRLNYPAPPVFSRAVAEYDQFLEIIAGSGAEILNLPPQPLVTLDSMYTRDAAVAAGDGVILCRMGKVARAAEPAAIEEQCRHEARPICGAIRAPGSLEGGDLIWLDARTVVVGQGRRTNAEGIRQLRALLGESVEDVAVVPLPDYPGQHDVMHLMSLVSPVDGDLAVIYSRLLPDACRRMLLDRGYRLIDVPEDEFETMGTNVLALAPRDCVMIEGNPKTRAALEAAGARVQVYRGTEISLKGGGGPTCLTRPLTRAIRQ